MQKLLQKIHKTALIIFVFFALTAAFSACGPDTGNMGGENPPGPTQSETGQPGPGDEPGANTGAEGETVLYEELYYIPMGAGYSWDGLELVIDRNGVTVPKDKQFAVLYDVLSGAPQCLALTRIEERGVDENNSTLIIYTAALFDLDGNLIYDWGDCSYSAGFGDFVIRRENVPRPSYDFLGRSDKNELLNFKTNQLYLEDVNMVYRLSDDKALLMDAGLRPLGVVNSAGTKLSGFPVDESYAFVRNWNGYIMARNRAYLADAPASPQSFLLTPDFEQLLVYSQLDESRSREILEYKEGEGTADERNGLVTIDGRELYRAAPDETIYWFNDNFIITRYDDRGYANPTGYKIISVSSGEILFDNAEVVPYSWYEDTKPFENLLVYSSGFLWLINKEKGEIGQKEIEEVSYIDPLAGEFFHVHTQSTNMILDRDLSEVIPGGKYDYMYRASRSTTNAYDYYDVFICGSYTDQYRFADLLDLDGRVLVEGLNDIYEAGPDRISVRKGFDVGLMDWQGNWIAKHSIFSVLLDD